MLVPAGGSTIILVPVPAVVPPHDTVNHCQVAPAPRLPPLTVIVFPTPLHVLLLVIVIPVGTTERDPTVTERVRSSLVPQLFSAVTLILPS